MYLDEDELRPCRACGRACDGDVCDEACRQTLEDRDTPDTGEFQDTSDRTVPTNEFRGGSDDSTTV